LKNTISVYARRGLIVTHALMDGQFKCLRNDIYDIGIDLNIVGANEHVPEAERYIRTLKERMRCIYNTVPFKKMPARMIIGLAYGCVFWLNNFPAHDGVSSTLSPRNIMTGRNVDFNKHCKLEFGDYVQIHEEHDNTMIPRTSGAIALRPTGNIQGGYFFYTLKTGRRVNRNHWTVVPMPVEVIDRVHESANRKEEGIVFEDEDEMVFEPADEGYDPNEYHMEYDDEEVHNNEGEHEVVDENISAGIGNTVQWFLFTFLPVLSV
jgi:hypothetical protein